MKQIGELIKKPVKVGRISFANIDPVYYGIDHGLKPPWLDIVSAPPSVLNKMLSKGELDISPVSSVAYTEHTDDWLLLPDICIACSGNVMSVVLVSKYPFNELHNKNVILTDESASAAKLLKLFFLMKKITPVFREESIKDSDNIYKKSDAFLVIGDTALEKKWSIDYKYVWDLGEMWKDMTGLPFVFSIWGVCKDFADKQPGIVSYVSSLFALSKKTGGKKIEEIAKSCSKKITKDTNFCISYYEKLCYDLGPLQISGLNTFFDALFNAGMIKNKINLSFFKQTSH